MRVIIAGSRTHHPTFADIASALKVLLVDKEHVTQIISGGATGVDRQGELYAEEKSIPLRVFNAAWDKYGKRAGPIRNQTMADTADALLAFWDGKSRGTKNMIECAKDNGLKLVVVQV